MHADDAKMRMIHRGAAGNAAALECFLLQHRQQLLGYLSHHLPANLRRVVEAQDLLQDSYFDAFQHIDQFTEGDSRSAKRWLVTIARNRLLQTIRAHQALKRGGNGASNVLDQMNDPADRSVVRLLQDLAVYERTPSQSAVSHEVLALVRRLIDQLPPEYRQAMWLRHVEGLSPRDIALKMNRTEHSVHMLCNRAIKALRTQLRSASHYY